MTEQLEVHGLTLSYGRVKAVDDLSLRVNKGEILGIIGPNGAGKTTLFDLLTGSRRPDRGRVILDGIDVTRVSPSRRCRLGIVRTHQIPRPFENMTVYENALVAAMNGRRTSERDCWADIHAVLNQLGLLPKKDCPARELRLIDRKLLETARCLAAHPKLLLLDEPAAGLGEQELGRIVRMVRNIRETGVTILWIEHIVSVMTGEVDRLLVMSEGKELINGPPAHVMGTKEVLDAYLGSEGEE